MNWTEGAIELLKQLRDEELSAGQIAPHLGCSRNAVIGKLHRLGMTTKILPTRSRQRGSQHKWRLSPSRGKIPMQLEDEHVENPILLVNAGRSQCRWPVSSEGLSLMVCGAVHREGSSYCPHHYRMSISGRPTTSAA